jgi:hypothetical protein
VEQSPHRIALSYTITYQNVPAFHSSPRFPVMGERRSFTLRWEAYNAFNHTQYSGITASPSYDLTIGAQTNTLFGKVPLTRAPRGMQGPLRFTF